MKKIFYVFLLVFMVFLVASCVGVGSTEEKAPPSDALYKDISASPEDRARDLLQYMSLEEKIGQMAMVDRQFLASEADIAEYKLGALLSGGGSAPYRNTVEAWRSMVEGYQKKALSTRLGIPLLYGIDAVHGHNNVYGATIFPHNIGLGATRDAELVERIERATALEVAATGIHWTFAPCVTVPQDERWGRTYEGFSEDPAVVAELGAAAIRGFQGGSDISSLGRPDTILATAKHFVADGGTEGGVDRGDAKITEEELQNIHLVPYVDAVKNSVATIMVSFSSINGVKMHSNKHLIMDVLRAKLGFDGLLVSDWAAHTELKGSLAQQLETVINAGLDMIMIPDSYKDFYSTMLKLVEEKKIPMSRIDDAVYHILLTKFRLGLFDNPFVVSAPADVVGSAEHRAIAREAVRKSLVVLKNDKSVLPLKRGAKIAVIGSKANDIGIQCGGWTISWQGKSGNITKGTTILEGLREVAGDSTEIVYHKNLSPSDEIDADVAVVVVGENPYAEMKGDNRSLKLSATDVRLVKTAAEKNIPVALIILSGRPILINEVLDYADAVVAAWLPGTEGAGVADVLMGDFKPVGKLPFAWPRSVSDLPLKIEDEGKALFPYNYGLTF
ncbi:glycoside hydrolase family 3 N-terminal domain-containing protein [Spirochaetia bacterium 38H-sp]|uniref:beta-glucosidase n=1 Tax=Rarispira pelagica TaxID=3141764 RepID=A0ABU9UDI1_9SPIR